MKYLQYDWHNWMNNQGNDSPVSDDQVLCKKYTQIENCHSAKSLLARVKNRIVCVPDSSSQTVLYPKIYI